MKRLLTTTIITLSIATIIILNCTNFFKTSAVELPKDESKTAQTETYGKIPLSFEPNAGQTDAQVKFLSRGNAYALFLTDTEAVLRLRNGDCKTDEAKVASAKSATTKDCEKIEGVLRMRFEDANPTPQVSGANELEGKSNYLNLDGAGAKLTNVPNFERVNYGGIYDGIDLVFYGNERQLEYDFNIQPNADPTQIELNFDGAENLVVDVQGNLVAEVAGKNVRFNAPVAYQTIKGERRTVAANYSIENKVVKFQIGDYDKSETLVIDPILQYSSYLGGSDRDEPEAITVNAAGEAFVAGETFSVNFPTANAIQPNLVGTSDGFLTKLNAAGSGVVFSTYLGGAGSQRIVGIALDAANNISIAGADSRNSYDVYIGKLNAAGSGLVYPTVFIGGSDFDYPYGIALDAAGNAFVTGRTDSTNFQTTTGVIQQNDGAGIGSFAVRVNTNGALAYSTYLDGAGDDTATDLAVDGAGNAYIAGNRLLNNDSNVFILKLNPTAAALVYPTYYIGGSGSDYAHDVEIDVNGNAYLGGQTLSSDFPTTAGVVQPTFGGGGYADGFVTKVNASGNGLVWSTYLGSTSVETVQALKRDSAGGIYVTGWTGITGEYNFYAAHLNPTATALDYNAQF
ncbi:MAG: SBBP repeat-containing protein, partial [Actinomycetota bacterium]